MAVDVGKIPHKDNAVMQVVNHTIAIDQKHTSRQRVIKIGARVVRHARAITCQLAEVAVTGPMVRAILAANRRLRAPPLCA